MAALGIASFIKWRSPPLRQQKILSFQQLLVIMMLLYSFVGIITKDPILSDVACTSWGVCLSYQYEWVLYVTGLGYFFWRFIIKDLKTEVSALKETTANLDKRVVRLETSMEEVKKILHFILEKAKLQFY